MTSSERISFEGSRGATLAARLELPSGEPVAYALFAHCFTCSKDVKAAGRIARALTNYGIGVLRFDFTGLGGSEGDFANTDFSSNVTDLVHAASFLRERYAAPAILIGHSFGGAAVLKAASEIPEVLAVATIGAPCDPEHITHLFSGHRDEIERTGEAEVQIAGRGFRIRRELLDDIASQNMQEAIGSLRRALLVFHAPRDETVGVENAARIFEAARHPKSFVSLDAADHLLSREEDAVYVADVLAAWVTRYLGSGAREAAAEPDAAGLPEGRVEVTAAAPGPYTQRIRVGRHVLWADEREGPGGDAGPTPRELLLAALGACTSITARMYADRKEWPLEGVTVELAGEELPEEERTGERAEGIHRVISLQGALTPEQRERIAEIAGRSPVSRTLSAGAALRDEVG